MRPEDTDYGVTEAMRCYGGGFVSLLAQLYRQADPDNRQRIKAAWPEYWTQYTELTRLMYQLQSKAEGG